MAKSLLWGAPGALADPPVLLVSTAEQDAQIIMALLDKYGLLDSVEPKLIKEILGQRIGYDDEVVSAVVAALTRSPQVNPGPMTPQSMAEQQGGIRAIDILAKAALLLSRACSVTKNLRQAHVWSQTTIGAEAITTAAEQQANQASRDGGVMESAQQVQAAIQKGLIRKKNTADGKAAAATEAESALQTQLSAVQAQLAQMAAKLSATEAALAAATGQNPPVAVGGTATTHHHKAPAKGTAAAPGVPSLGASADAQRKTQR